VKRADSGKKGPLSPTEGEKTYIDSSERDVEGNDVVRVKDSAAHRRPGEGEGLCGWAGRRATSGGGLREFKASGERSTIVWEEER